MDQRISHFANVSCATKDQLQDEKEIFGERRQKVAGLTEAPARAPGSTTRQSWLGESMDDQGLLSTRYDAAKLLAG